MGGLNRHRVHHRVYGHSRQGLLFLKGYAELVERFKQLGIHFIKALGPLFLFGRGVIAYGLIVDFRNVEMSPCRHLQRQPVTVGLQSEFKQPLGFAFLFRYKTDYILVESARNHIGVDVAYKSILVFAVGDIAYYVIVAGSSIVLVIFSHFVAKVDIEI